MEDDGRLDFIGEVGDRNLVALEGVCGLSFLFLSHKYPAKSVSAFQKHAVRFMAYRILQTLSPSIRNAQDSSTIAMSLP